MKCGTSFQWICSLLHGIHGYSSSKYLWFSSETLKNQQNKQKQTNKKCGLSGELCWNKPISFVMHRATAGRRNLGENFHVSRKKKPFPQTKLGAELFELWNKSWKACPFPTKIWPIMGIWDFVSLWTHKIWEPPSQNMGIWDFANFGLGNKSWNTPPPLSQLKSKVKLLGLFFGLWNFSSRTWDFLTGWSLNPPPPLPGQCGIATGSVETRLYTGRLLSRLR